MLLVSVPQNLNCVEVEVLLVRDDFEDMPAGGERYAQLADPLEGVPAAGVGHGNAAGDVDAIDFDVEAGRWRPVAIACSEFDVVLGAGGHVLARPVLTPGIAFDVVVVGDAFAAEIEVLRLKGAGNRDRDSGIRRGSGHGSSDPNRVQVEVLLVRDDFEDMPAGGERYAQLADPLEGVPAAGVGHGNAAGDVDAIDFDVEAGRWRPVAIACSEFDVVLGAGGHVDGIGEPLSGLEVVHDITAAQGVGGHDDVHVLARPVLTPGIAFDVVVVGDAFAAEVEVLRLKGAGNRDRDSGIRRGSGHGSSDPNRVQVEVLLVRDDFEDMPAGGERYAQLADPLEGVPAAGVGHGNAAGDVDAIDFDVEAGRWRPVAIACSEFDVVLGAGGHVDGIGEPLSGLEVVHDITTAQGVGGHDDVHVLARPVLTPGIAFDVVVVGDAFAAEIEVLRFDQPRHGEWRAFEGRLSAWGGKGPERLIGRHREVPQRILGLHPVV